MSSPSTASSTRSVVHEFIHQVRSGRDLGRAHHTLAAQVLAHQLISEAPATLRRDAADYARHIEDFIALWGRFELAVDEFIVEGDRAYVRWTQTGRHLGSFDGEAPSGQPLRETASAVYRVQDGRIVEYWIQTDRHGLSQQLARHAGAAASLPFEMVDVFSSGPFSGNPLPVVFDERGLDAHTMQQLTRQFRQFETVFVTPTDDPWRWQARIFDLEAELRFAGHPLLGAAAAIARRAGLAPGRGQPLVLLLGEREVQLHITSAQDGSHEVWLDAGTPDFAPVPEAGLGPLLQAMNLTPEDSVSGLPLELASTGLRYLMLPVRAQALARARIREDIGPLLQRLGAEYAVLVDPQGLEQRHWSNDGRFEDSATGSATSVVGPYLVRHGLAAPGTLLRLRQGRFTGRASELLLRVEGDACAIEASWLGGQVRRTASGHITL